MLSDAIVGDIDGLPRYYITVDTAPAGVNEEEYEINIAPGQVALMANQVVQRCEGALGK